jgi:kinesin family protein 11
MGGVKVDVFVRVRPPNDMEKEKGDPVTAAADGETQEIVLQDPSGHEARYKYDKVYGPEATQAELYDDAVSPIVEQVCRGMSCCIFAYGQTGAGKTFTMRGDLSEDTSKHGIIQRSLQNLFQRLQEQDYTDISVRTMEWR